MRKLILFAAMSLLLAGCNAASSSASSTSVLTPPWNTSSASGTQVPAGVVNVASSVDIVGVYELGGAPEEEYNGEYISSIGGRTYLDSDHWIHFERWAPGDKAVIRCQVENKSNVAIKTRFVETHTSTTNPDLYEVLDIKYEFEQGYTGVITEENFKKWSLVAPSETENNNLFTLTITIEFPDTYGSGISFSDETPSYVYADCAIAFCQEAAQGNAPVSDSSEE